MSSPADDPEVGPLVADLVRTLRELESEFEPRTESGLPRPPSPSELVRFTSDVGIPGVILLLRTNIEALKLLQRALRLADGRAPTTGSEGTEVRRRAERLSRTTLSRLDGALADLQDAVEGRPENDDARELLDEARSLRDDVERKLSEGGGADGNESSSEADEATDLDEVATSESVPVDVDAELRSIKEEFEDGSDGNGASGGDDGANGDGSATGHGGTTGDRGAGADDSTGSDVGDSNDTDDGE